MVEEDRRERWRQEGFWVLPLSHVQAEGQVKSSQRSPGSLSGTFLLPPPLRTSAAAGVSWPRWRPGWASSWPGTSGAPPPPPAPSGGPGRPDGDGAPPPTRCSPAETTPLVSPTNQLAGMSYVLLCGPCDPQQDQTRTICWLGWGPSVGPGSILAPPSSNQQFHTSSCLSPPSRPESRAGPAAAEPARFCSAQAEPAHLDAAQRRHRGNAEGKKRQTQVLLLEKKPQAETSKCRKTLTALNIEDLHPS